MTELLAVRDLHVSYAGAAVCRGVSFEVMEGELVLLMGANGAGKTTILRTIAGLKRPSAGRVNLGGRDVTGWAGHRVVSAGAALVPEGRQVFPDHSVEENLRLGGFSFRSDRRGTRAGLEEMFALFPVLGERRKQQAGSLSGGEAQMLAVARALMARPRLLMLDEPSLGLAPLIVEQIFDHLAALNRERGLSVLLVEQAAAAAMRVAQRALVLDAGRIVMSGTTAEIAADPKVQEIYFGATQASGAERLG